MPHTEYGVVYGHDRKKREYIGTDQDNQYTQKTNHYYINILKRK